MHEKLKGVEAVSFDLDECLFPSSPEINDRARTRICESILERRPDFGSVSAARDYFEREYRRLQSGRQVLRGLGFEDADAIMDKSTGEAEVADLLRRDEKLASIAKMLKERYVLGLITGSSQGAAERKLDALGIPVETFNVLVPYERGYKRDGEGFRYFMRESGILEARQHVYVGNSLKADILPAKSVGMRTVAVWSEIPEADVSIPHIYDVEKILL